MQIKSLKLNNFANYSEVNVSFSDTITYLIGKNGSGKSTLGVNAIWAMFAGIAEKGKTALIGERFRFIGPKAATASGEMVLHDEAKNVDIIVRRKISKSGNEVSFEAPDGYPVSQQWLEDLFNVFLIAPKKFTELSSKQQAEALGIDTSEMDNELKTLKSEFTLINRDLTNIGNFEAVEKVEAVDISNLNKEKDSILDFNRVQSEIESDIVSKNNYISQLENQAQANQREIDILLIAQDAIKVKINNTKAEIASIPKAEAIKPLDEINEKINSASDTNLKAFQYEQYLVKLEKHKEVKGKIEANKTKQEANQKRRKDYIKSQKLPFDNLEINEDGELLLSGKPIKEPYFSTGELIRTVPILMSAKNPELKYVFIQDFNLLDEDKQNEVETYLTGKGMQLVIELVGTQKVNNENSILLKDCAVVDSYEDVKPKNIL